VKIAILKRAVADVARSGGLEKYALRVTEAFQTRGADVTLLSDNTLSLSRFSFRKIEQFDKYCREYLAHTPHEVVFGMDRNRFQTHLRAGNGVHAAYLDLRKNSEGFFKAVSFSFNPLHRTLLQIEKEAFEHPALQRLIVNSAMVQRQVLQYYNVDPKKIVVLHNGVEWSEMQAEVEKTDRFEFLFVGHNFQRKGLHKLLEALACCRCKEFHLSVIGEDKNLPYFESLAQKLNICVTFLGKQNNTLPFFRKADALVIPSFYDPFANVTVEALAMGLFVISSKSNGGHEVLTHQSGIVIEELENKESFIAALETAMGHPKTKKSAEAIRETVHHLDFSYQLKKLCDLCLS
jgi:UDP-glucose:(heptosyl)LPS alpha-1,3-glucosyltransferase